MNRTVQMRLAVVGLGLAMALAAGTVSYAAKSSSEIGDYRTWTEVDVSQWSPRSGDSILDVLAPAIGGHPESTEGRPVLQLDVQRAAKGDGLLARITMTGYLDDSVSGEQIVAEIVQDAGGWSVARAWQRWQCGRGANAGKWSIKTCP